MLIKILRIQEKSDYLILLHVNINLIRAVIFAHQSVTKVGIIKKERRQRSGIDTIKYHT